MENEGSISCLLVSGGEGGALYHSKTIPFSWLERSMDRIQHRNVPKYKNYNGNVDDQSV